tara:strand:- start:1500 stop:1826 length:327 start_codon:yes stop_codon:yes gene_type:complete
MDSNNSVNLDDLTKEVNSSISTGDNKTQDIMVYVNKCLHRPLMYITSIPLCVLTIIFILDPDYIYDINQDTDKKTINYNKLFKLMLVGSIIANAFIHCQMKKNCQINL